MGKVVGKFEIYTGDELYAKGKNKWTRDFAASLAQIVAFGQCAAWTSCYHSVGMAYRKTARAGSDTTTPTSPDMTDLVSKIDVAPNNSFVVLGRSYDYKEYYVKYSFIWNAGVLPVGTIGEFGVWLYCGTSQFDSPWNNPCNCTARYQDGVGGKHTMFLCGLNPTSRMVARISSADGAFEPIDYDGSLPVTLVWRFVIKF